MLVSSCPCGSDRPYAQCCQPLHQGSTFAQTAEQLMRSRYSAFALGLTDYIKNTTLPAQQPFLDMAGIEQWAASCRFTALEILSTEAGQSGDASGKVEFIAQFYLENVKDLQAHHELSSFKQCQKRWYFIDPNVNKSPQRNDPCPCGSGRKYKKCCG